MIPYFSLILPLTGWPPDTTCQRSAQVLWVLRVAAPWFLQGSSSQDLRGFLKCFGFSIINHPCWGTRTTILCKKPPYYTYILWDIYIYIYYGQVSVFHCPVGLLEGSSEKVSSSRTSILIVAAPGSRAGRAGEWQDQPASQEGTPSLAIWNT